MKKGNRVKALTKDIVINFKNGVIETEVGSPLYHLLHHEKHIVRFRLSSELNELINGAKAEWNCKGFLGYKK